MAQLAPTGKIDIQVEYAVAEAAQVRDRSTQKGNKYFIPTEATVLLYLETSRAVVEMTGPRTRSPNRIGWARFEVDGLYAPSGNDLVDQLITEALATIHE